MVHQATNIETIYQSEQLLLEQPQLVTAGQQDS